MSLMNVFESLTDAILVINYEGELTYLNAAASNITDGDTISTLGIKKLSDMLTLVINDDIPLPVRFKVIPNNSKQEYNVTVTKMYSLFIVSLIPVTQDQLASSTSLAGYSISTSDAIKQQLSQIEVWLQKNPQQADIAGLQQKLDDLSVSVSLLLEPDRQTQHDIHFAALMTEAAQQLAHRNEHRGFNVSIYENTQAEITVSYPADWLKKAFADCMLYMHRLDKQHHVMINIEHKPFYTQIQLHSVAEADLALMDTTQRYISLYVPAPAYSANRSSNNLTIATQILHKLKGNLRINRDKLPFSLFLQLPTEEDLVAETELMVEQSKQFALELAELKAQMERIPV